MSLKSLFPGLAGLTGIFHRQVPAGVAEAADGSPPDAPLPPSLAFQEVEPLVVLWSPLTRFGLLGSIDLVLARALLARELRARMLAADKRMDAVQMLLTLWQNDPKPSVRTVCLDIADALDHAGAEMQDSSLFPLANAVRLLSLSSPTARRRKDVVLDARTVAATDRVAQSLMAEAEELFAMGTPVRKDMAAHLAWVCMGWVTSAMAVNNFCDGARMLHAGAFQIGHSISRHRAMLLAALRLEQRTSEDPYQNVMTMEDEFGGAASYIRRSRGNAMLSVRLDGDDPGVELLDDAGAAVHARPLSRSAVTVRVCEPLSVDKKSIVMMLGHEHIVGADVPLVRVGDLAKVRSRLVFEFPHAIEVIDQALNDLVGRETVKISPMVLVGNAGVGKSRFVRRLGELLGVYIWRVDASRSDSNSFGGTDRRWSTAEPCHPFLAISRARHGNPLVVIEEMEKIAVRTDNGRLWDCLLGFTERETSARYPDPGLQRDLNLSEVSYVCTANDIENLPAQLRDRFKAIVFPEPQAVHIDALIPPIVEDYIVQRRLDPGWVPALIPMERDALAARWKGGSIRKLTRMVAAVMRAREKSAPKH